MGHVQFAGNNKTGLCQVNILDTAGYMNGGVGAHNIKQMATTSGLGMCCWQFVQVSDSAKLYYLNIRQETGATTTCDCSLYAIRVKL